MNTKYPMTSLSATRLLCIGKLLSQLTIKMSEHGFQVDEKHEKRLKEQTQNALGENVDEKVLLLETELVEAIEAKNVYKVQLQR